EEAVRRTGRARPITGLGRVAGTGGGGAAHRARSPDAVRRAAGARPGAVLCGIAEVDGSATDGARRLEAVRRTGSAGPGTALGHVADVGRRTAHRAGRHEIIRR